jgi:hypothetical protein
VIANLREILTTRYEFFEGVAALDETLDEFLGMSIVSKDGGGHLGHFSLECLIAAVVLDNELNLGSEVLALAARDAVKGGSLLVVLKEGGDLV